MSSIATSSLCGPRAADHTCVVKTASEGLFGILCFDSQAEQKKSNEFHSPQLAIFNYGHEGDPVFILFIIARKFASLSCSFFPAAKPGWSIRGY